MNSIINHMTQAVGSLAMKLPTISPEGKKIAAVVSIAFTLLSALCFAAYYGLRRRDEKIQIDIIEKRLANDVLDDQQVAGGTTKIEEKQLAVIHKKEKLESDPSPVYLFPINFKTLLKACAAPLFFEERLGKQYLTNMLHSEMQKKMGQKNPTSQKQLTAN